MKKIGIVGYAVNDMFGIGTSYANYFSQFGEVVILTPETPVLDLDLLVIPGGPDVNPSRYGEKPNFKTGKQCPFREYFDEVMLPQYIDKRTKMVGIK